MECIICGQEAKNELCKTCYKKGKSQKKKSSPKMLIIVMLSIIVAYILYLIVFEYLMAPSELMPELPKWMVK